LGGVSRRRRAKFLAKYEATEDEAYSDMAEREREKMKTLADKIEAAKVPLHKQLSEAQSVVR
jgi:hypothetical protein